jgi:large subunit ribosomal protein L5
MNPMQQIRIEKVTLNIGVGKAGDELEKSIALLQKITNHKPIKTKTMKRIPTWGLRPNLTIGCKVTLRKKDAEQLLIRLFKAIDNKLKPRQFDKEGNFSFGVPEYIDIPGAEYDPKIGIIGLEVAVTLEKPGFRIKKRSLKTKKIPKKHKITQEEAIKFVSEKFNVKISSEAE